MTFLFLEQFSKNPKNQEKIKPGSKKNQILLVFPGPV